MKRLFKALFLFVFISLIAYGAFYLGGFFRGRTHGMVYAQKNEFTESAKKLQNPNRGFYELFGVVVAEQEEDYTALVRQKIQAADELELYLVQVNLCRFREGAISKEGLANVENLFAALEESGKQYIIRFLYDWEGNGMEAEPDHIEVVQKHMQQLEGIFRKYKHIIFVHQGIFVGSYGEMHGSKYLSYENMQTLLNQLAAVTEEATFLAVRTPSQWRKLTQISQPEKEEMAMSSLANRLSLYNDGMLGTEQDCGTYGVLSKTEAGLWEPWNREEELEFQNRLCRQVPNGGEVIIENAQNDFSHAVDSLAAMHVTYLNQDYDQAVLDKWAEARVSEEGCFDGMDGLSYIERHLGYRLLIADTAVSYDFWQDRLAVDITLRNEGFAPMYKKPDLYLILHQEEEKQDYVYQLTEDVRVLSGGKDKEDLLTLHKEISLKGLEEGEYSLFFFLKDTDSGMHIQLANEQEEETYGYGIGSLQIETMEKTVEAFWKRETDF